MNRPLNSMPSLLSSHSNQSNGGNCDSPAVVIARSVETSDLSAIGERNSSSSSLMDANARRKQMYSKVIEEMNTRTASADFVLRSTRHGDHYCHDKDAIETIVPSSSHKRVVLIASKSRSVSDCSDEVDRLHHHHHHANEDSGLQADASKSTLTDESFDGDQAPVTTKKTGTTVISIAPPSDKIEHRLLEHLHSTPLPAVIDAQLASPANNRYNNNNNNNIIDEEDAASSSSSSSCSSGQQTATASLDEGLNVQKSNGTAMTAVNNTKQQQTPVDALPAPRPRELNKGPDQMAPAESFITTEASGAVKLKIDERGIGSIPPLSVPTLFQRTVARHMDHTAMAVKRDGKWIKWTYKQYLHDVMLCAKAFVRLGLERFHSVCILGFNSPEWLISNLAAIHAGGFAAGIYTTNSAESCLHCALNGRADIVVVEDRKQLEKILLIKDKIPTLKAIVQYSGKPHVEGVITWSQLLNLGNSTPDSAVEDRLKLMATNQCCTLIYTSGTTGPPKGVMLSHDNLTWVSHALATYMDVRDGKESFLSYLPLSHVAAQLTDIYVPLSAGGTVYFAQPDALKGSLVETLRDVRPTLFFGVPRVWEKVYEKMQAVGKQTRGLKKAVAKWAKSVGLKYNRSRMDGYASKPLGYALANALVFKKVRDALGLDRARIILSGAAPLSREVSEYFMSLDMPIMEVYGMSESSGPHSINNATKGYKACCAGKTVPGCQTKIANPDKDGNGEILMGGRHVFMGYLNDPGQTAGAIDGEFFLHTGDVGQLDKFGFVNITGRLKELLITAGGENVAPVLIEDNIKAELPIVSHAVVVGDRRKFLSVLLTLKTEVDPETQEPMPVLMRETRAWCEQNGLSLAETVTDVISAAERGRNDAGAASPAFTVHETEAVKFVCAIDAAIEQANRKAISAAQRVQKWTFLPVDFSVSGGELGPTMKMKRSVITKKYADIIERFY